MMERRLWREGSLGIAGKVWQTNWLYVLLILALAAVGYIALYAAAGGSPEDVIKVTVWMKDRSQRRAINPAWLAMFPDEHSRPARQTMTAELDGGKLIQCDFVAVIEGKGSSGQ